MTAVSTPYVANPTEAVTNTATLAIHRFLLQSYSMLFTKQWTHDYRILPEINLSAFFSFTKLTEKQLGNMAW